MDFVFIRLYLTVDNADLYTTVCLPEANGKFPVVVGRNPYVDAQEDFTDDQMREAKLAANAAFLKAGYAVVEQHCRGCGRSGGECVPYINEREDGLALLDWIRKQDFYNGEIFLNGGSYTASVHYVLAPFASDIKGAVLAVQDCERYNPNYRNGFYKMGLHGNWYVGMYKRKQIPNKNFTPETFKTLPLKDFSRIVFGESAPDFDEILKHPKRNDSFWTTRFGGGEAHDAVKNVNIPILLTTSFYDIYTGGIFDMWNTLSPETKSQSALVVTPYGHGMHETKIDPIKFPYGNIGSRVPNHSIRWFNAVRNKGNFPVERGKVTYYRLFENAWKTEDFGDGGRELAFPLGKGEISYVYNPYNPATFKGGLSANFGGTAWQDPPNSHYDIKSFEMPAFETDTFVKGKMKAKLLVRSDCEDTCFYVRVSLVKEDGQAFGLRDDITQISNFDENYRPNSEIMLDFSFDEHAFLARKGEKLRVDVSSSAFPWYVPHTNQRGLFSEQTAAKTAHNTVLLEKSFLFVPAE